MKQSVVAKQQALLFASVSALALAAASTAVNAAEPTFKEKWNWWIEGGTINSGGGSTNVGLPGPFGFGAPGPFGIGFTPPFTDRVSIKPKWGGEGAIGFDYQPMGSLYHYSGQFRYGATKKKTKNFSQSRLFSLLSTGGSPSTFTGAANTTGSATIRDQHWLVDFAVGRDFALGSGNVQVKAGVRVADLLSKTNANASIFGCEHTSVVTPACGSPVNGSFSFQSRSRFLGAGPRLGVDGSMPIAGSWAVEYLGGVAVLVGERSLKATINETLTDPDDASHVYNNTVNINSSKVASIFNLDGQAGISYWVTPAFKMMASYRFDGYWSALRTLNASGNVVNEDRFYYGPMLRATAAF